MTEQESLIQAINENAGQGNRLCEYVYADWLDERGDPRGEAWRVLIGEGKRPFRNDRYPEMPYEWFLTEDATGDEENSVDYNLYHAYAKVYIIFYETFHSAMNAAAIAWVRHHRDPNFLRTVEPIRS